MDPIASSSIHHGVWERFVPRRSRIPGVSIDLLKGAVRPVPSASNNNNSGGAFITATHPALLSKVEALDDELSALTPQSCEQMLRYLLSDDTALPTHDLFAHGNTTCAGLLAEIAKDEAAVEERRRAEAAARPDSTTEDGELFDENKSQRSSHQTGSVAAEEMPAELRAMLTADEYEDAREQLRLEAAAAELREAAGVAWVPFLDKVLDVSATHSLTNSQSQSEALKRADKEYGCVVYGAYGCLDDAKWSTSTRSVHCHDLYDVFVSMRMSAKLSSDLRRQLGIAVKEDGSEGAEDESSASPQNNDAVGGDDDDECEDFNAQVSRQITEIIARQKEVASLSHDEMRKRQREQQHALVEQEAASNNKATASLSPSNPTAIIRLTQHKAFAEGAEFRAFVLVQRRRGGAQPTSSSEYDVTVLGICQKRVDQVFDFLLGERHNKSIAAAAEDVLVALFTKEIEDQTSGETTTTSTLASSIFEHLVSPAACASSSSSSASNDAITDIVIGIDITIESASLPIYILGMSAVACGSQRWPFLTEAEKARGAAAVVSSSSSDDQQNPFAALIIEKQSIPFCRLFRTLSDLKGHFLATRAGSPSTHSQMNACVPTIYVASDHTELVGDGKQMFSHSAIPKELADTESFLAALQQSQGGGNGSAGAGDGGGNRGSANGSDDSDPTSLSALMRHLQNR